MSNFKSLQSTIQGGSSSFAPFNPQDTAGTPQKRSANTSGGVASRPTPAVSELQKLQQQLQAMTQQNQLLQQQLQESQMYQQQLDQQLQQKEHEVTEKMQFYRDVMSSIQEVYQRSSQDIQGNFVQFLEMIFNGIFASSVIMDAALYASLSTVFEDLQDQNVVVGVHPNQSKVVEGFIQDLGIKKWVIQSDSNLDVGGFRIESQLSQWLQSPQASVQQIISRIETHLKNQ